MDKLEQWTFSQVEAAKRYEKQMHRPGNLAFLVIVAVVVVAMACAYWTMVLINSIPD